MRACIKRSSGSREAPGDVEFGAAMVSGTRTISISVEGVATVAPVSEVAAAVLRPAVVWPAPFLAENKIQMVTDTNRMAAAPVIGCL